MTPEEIALMADINANLKAQRDDLGEIKDKVKEFCNFRLDASVKIGSLQDHCENTKDIPGRVSALELKVMAIIAGLMVIVTLIGWDWLKFGAV